MSVSSRGDATSTFGDEDGAAGDGTLSSGSSGQSSNDASGDARRAPARDHRAYWRANLRVMSILLTIWFVVSYGLGIVFVEPLNQVRIGGFPLGFWFSQQGSIYVFVILIFVYARWMDRIDARYGVD